MPCWICVEGSTSIYSQALKQHANIQSTDLALTYNEMYKSVFSVGHTAKMSLYLKRFQWLKEQVLATKDGEMLPDWEDSLCKGSPQRFLGLGRSCLEGRQPSLGLFIPQIFSSNNVLKRKTTIKRTKGEVFLEFEGWHGHFGVYRVSSAIGQMDNHWGKPLAKRKRTYTQNQGESASEVKSLVSDSSGTTAASFVQSEL